MTPSPLEEEAGKLLAAVQHWLANNARNVHIATGSPDCCVCPLCQLIAVGRSSGPELLEHLTSAAGQAFAAFRSFADASTTQPDTEATEPRSSGVQRIDVDE